MLCCTSRVEGNESGVCTKQEDSHTVGNSSSHSEATSAAASRSMRSTSARRRSSTPHSASKRRLSAAWRSACRDARTAHKQTHKARALFGTSDIEGSGVQWRVSITYCTEWLYSKMLVPMLVPETLKGFLPAFIQVPFHVQCKLYSHIVISQRIHREHSHLLRIVQFSANTNIRKEEYYKSTDYSLCRAGIRKTNQMI